MFQCREVKLGDMVASDWAVTQLTNKQRIQKKEREKECFSAKNLKLGDMIASDWAVTETIGDVSSAEY